MRSRVLNREQEEPAVTLFATVDDQVLIRIPFLRCVRTPGVPWVPVGAIGQVQGGKTVPWRYA
jgi:hypothetical protein